MSYDAFLRKLADELNNDPLGRGYAGMTDAQAVIDINTAYVSSTVTSLTGDDVFNATDGAEFNALTAGNKQLWLLLCVRSDINPNGGANRALATTLFGGGSTTVANLLAISDKIITRWQALGAPREVALEDVTRARAL